MKVYFSWFLKVFLSALITAWVAGFAALLNDIAEEESLIRNQLYIDEYIYLLCHGFFGKLDPSSDQAFFTTLSVIKAQEGTLGSLLNKTRELYENKAITQKTYNILKTSLTKPNNKLYYTAFKKPLGFCKAPLKTPEELSQAGDRFSHLIRGHVITGDKIRYLTQKTMRLFSNHSAKMLEDNTENNNNTTG